VDQPSGSTGILLIPAKNRGTEEPKRKLSKVLGSLEAFVLAKIFFFTYKPVSLTVKIDE
jgi:hypothetical protein